MVSTWCQQVLLVFAIMYVSDGLVETVEWPLMPSTGSLNLNGNPNNEVYRTEVFTAINDCLLKGRSQPKFIAFVDVD